jgi:DNA-binding PadR family transcriptional regulator
MSDRAGLSEAGRGAGEAAAIGRDPTDFEQVLIGLIDRRPQSAYDLRRFFARSPAIVYQPSAGALVPALHRLERRGLLAAEIDPASGRRARRVYQLTDAGRAVHLRWLRRPVEPATVGCDLGVHLMRFAMMERYLAREEVLAFLRALAAALDDFCASIEEYLKAAELPGRHPRLALVHGLAVHRASAAWAHGAIAELASCSPPSR